MSLDKQRRGSLDKASNQIETDAADIGKLLSALDANGNDINNIGNADVAKLRVD